MSIVNKFKSRQFYILIMIALIICSMFFGADKVMKLSYPKKYENLVISYSDKYKIDPYLVFAIIKAESNFNKDAISPKKARGLMQISEMTGGWGAKTLKFENYKVDMLYDPDINIQLGCWYLNNLMGEFGENIDLALAAYNGGSGNVKEWLKRDEYSKDGTKLDAIPFRETSLYVEKVKNYYKVYVKLYD